MENFKVDGVENRPRGGSFHVQKSFREPEKKEEPKPEEDGALDFNAIDDIDNLRNLEMQGGSLFS